MLPANVVVLIFSIVTDSSLQVWEAPDTGLLISERLLNCPPQLAPPLQQALFDEISWAIDDEPTQVVPTINPFHLPSAPALLLYAS